LKINHPVAFIDAWADDLADQPLVALMATLKTALAPLMGQPAVQSRWSKLAEKGGKVARIVAVGAAKRGLGVLISHAVVDALTDVMAGAGDAFKENVDDALTAAGEHLGEEVAKSLRLSGDMDAQVSDFHTAQVAMREMKDSLSDLVYSINDTRFVAPIVIIIDELDRCRPSYAIKLLEEIKHLFDVPGVVFIFGLHGDQLAHSVRGAYGSTFDGHAYLRRFINRRYSLAKPNTNLLIDGLLKASALDESSFFMPSGWRRRGRSGGVSPTSMINYYADRFRLSARDLIQMVDMLETSVTVAHPTKIILSYILPLIVERLREPSPLTFSGDDGFRYTVDRDKSEHSAQALFGRFEHLVSLSAEQFRKAWNESEEYAVLVIAEASEQARRQQNLMGAPENYRRLISAVSRFTRGG
jgi:hypothetical protein